MVSEGMERSSVSFRALWFGLLGGPVAWTLQLLVDYPLVAHSCFPDAARRMAPAIDSLHLLVIVTSAIALLVAVLALVTALRSWRTSGGSLDDSRTDSTDESPPVGRVRFMALGGILASSLTIVGIAMHGGFILLMAPCR